MIGIDKIERPPAAENWSRMQSPDVERTAKNIFHFLRGQPIWGYQTARKVASYYFEDQICRETGLKIVNRHGGKLGRPFNKDLVEAFFDYVEKFPVAGVKAFENSIDYFPLRRNSWIPVKPLTVIKDNGEFTPIFLCPWSNVSFDSYQKSLFMTVLEKAIFTQTDFENSPGKVLFFPKVKVDSTHSLRKPMIWTRGDIPLLTNKELNDQVKIFFEGSEKAKVLYQDHLNAKSGREKAKL